MDLLFGLLVIVACIGFYFIPAIVGWNKRNFTSIFLLNLFLGWTFIGWVVALVWAASKDNVVQQPTKQHEFNRWS